MFAGLVAATLSSQAMTICPATIQQAANGQTYQCTNAPGGADYGYLHFVATNLKPGQNYHCQIASNIVMLTYNGFQAASGVKLSQLGDNHTPFTYVLDTQGMSVPVGSASVEMYVPPSDMTSTVTFSCKVQ